MNQISLDWQELMKVYAVIVIHAKHEKTIPNGACTRIFSHAYLSLVNTMIMFTKSNDDFHMAYNLCIPYSQLKRYCSVNPDLVCKLTAVSVTLQT